MTNTQAPQRFHTFRVTFSNGSTMWVNAQSSSSAKRTAEALATRLHLLPACKASRLGVKA